MSYVKPKNINIKARLRTKNYANFLEFYHKGSALNDYFYKYLVKLADSHKLLANQDTQFKSHFNPEGFYFKTKETIKCKNAIKMPCLLDDLLDRDVTMQLKITPYNFKDAAGAQLIGISIQAVAIYA